MDKEMRFDVGNIVRISSKAKERYDSGNYQPCPGFNNSMERLQGSLVTITRRGEFYDVRENDYAWADWMLEEATQKEISEYENSLSKKDRLLRENQLLVNEASKSGSYNEGQYFRFKHEKLNPEVSEYYKDILGSYFTDFPTKDSLFVARHDINRKGYVGLKDIITRTHSYLPFQWLIPITEKEAYDSIPLQVFGKAKRVDPTRRTIKIKSDIVRYLAQESRSYLSEKTDYTYVYLFGSKNVNKSDITVSGVLKCECKDGCGVMGGISEEAISIGTVNFAKEGYAVCGIGRVGEFSVTNNDSRGEGLEEISKKFPDLFCISVGKDGFKVDMADHLNNLQEINYKIVGKL